MESYTEQEIRDALDKTGLAIDTPFVLKSLQDSRKEKTVTFTKAELLEYATGPSGRVKIHGIFGELGKDEATEKEICKIAGDAGFLSSTTELLKKVRKEKFQPGDVVKDTFGVYWQRTHNGKWARFDTTMYHDDAAPSRPLTKV